MSIYGERMARVETEIKELRLKAEENKITNDQQFHKVNEQFTEVNEKFKEVNDKLDQILTLRDKGVGAFWLASVIFGTGIVGALAACFNWMWKGS